MRQLVIRQKLRWRLNGRAGVLLAVCCCLPAVSLAANVLDEWRNNASQIRLLAESNAPRAHERTLQLQTALPAAATAADRARVLNLLARTEIYMALTEQAASHAQLALQLATQSADRVGQAEAKLNVALNAINQGRIDAAAEAATDSLTLLDGIDRPDLLAEALLRVTIMYRRLGQLEASVAMAMRAMQTAQRLHDPLALTYAYQGLAITYSQGERAAEARDNYLHMRDQARLAHSKLLEAFALNGLGTVYWSLGDEARAESSIRAAIALYREAGVPFGVSVGLFGLADQLQRQGRYAQALPLYDEMSGIYAQYPNKIGLWYMLNARSVNYEALGNTRAARRDAETAYALAKDIGVPLYLSDSAQRMATLTVASGHYRQAYQLLFEAHAVTIEAARENINARMLELARRYEAEGKQREIDELTHRNELQAAELRQRVLRQGWLWTVLMGSVIALACTAWFLLRLRRAQVELTTSNQQLRDEVDERKRAEAEIQRLNKELELRVAQRTAALSATNKELEAFSYSLSHDLRSPLRIIEAFTQILRESYGAKLDATGLEHLQQVGANAKRMNLLIDDMLKLFRMSQHEMQLTAIDLSALARDIVAGLRRAHPERQITVAIAPALEVMCDASLLRIALENLLGNAWKFTRNTPQARIEVDCIRADDNVTYFVRDNGAGFDKSRANKLFTPFQRMHSEHQFEGTGIGLAVVQRVIDRHGGKIKIDSRVNQGTTVYFELQADCDLPAPDSPVSMKRYASVVVGVLLASHASLALAQQGVTDASLPAAVDEVVVIGVRESLISTQAIKRNQDGIVDAVVADDVNKLPDLSVSDALQRITGVQIARDRGEGTAVAIRGLTQMETTLNGREVFTAGTGRNLDFADVSAEMVSSINVYKTSSAEHIEGGVGGMIDLRTRRPFDFALREVVMSARLIHGELVGRNAAQFSTLLSDRWETDYLGEFGALVNFSYQKRAWREDQKITGNPIGRTDLIVGKTVVAPNGTSETISLGERQRRTASVVLQWRPSDNSDFYLEGSDTKFNTVQDSQQINVSAAAAFVADSVQLFPGTNDLQRITWINAPISILSFARDTVDHTKQLATGGQWRAGAVTLNADVSRTTSFNNLFFSGPMLSATAVNFTQDLATRVPSSSITGTDLLDPANYQFTAMTYRTRPFKGELTAAQVDGEYTLSGPFLQSLAAGVRHAKRGATNAPGLIFADAAVTGISAADRSQFVMPTARNDFFTDQSVPSIRNFLVGNLLLARDPTALRQAFGITTPIPSAASPLGIWHIDEDTQAAYLMAKFKTADLPLTGNIGVRVVRTHESMSGAQSVPVNATVTPVNIRHTYTDLLPSANLRYWLSKDLVLRASASKTLTRPNFDQLSPSLMLLVNSVNPLLNQGSAGNPELQPIRADNLDVSAEQYFNPITAVYVTGFWKRADGFVTTVSNPEVYDGVAYQVSRPQNSSTADIKGIELGYQQFYDFLPGWLSGFGIQANYTHIRSELPNSTLNVKVPLQNLSKHSYNLIGMYEHNKVFARVAYNWRDKFLSGVTNIVGVGALPIYTKAYGWLDASMGYRFNNHTSFAVEGSNLLGTLRSSYYGVVTRPHSSWVNDTQLSATMTVRL